jgi:predicted DNA-binding transcriptional regulator AlpA
MTFEQLCELFNYVPKNRLLDTNEVAEILDVHPSTVNHYRLRGEGPRYFSPPGTRRVWYSEYDVLAWMASGARQSTSEQVAA